MEKAMKFKQDYDTPETTYKDLPAGKYATTISGAEFKTDGTVPRVNIEFTIVVGDFANRKVWYNQKWDEDSEPYIYQNLKAMGHTDLAKKEIEDILKDSIGRDCLIYIKPREYNNKTYYNVYVNDPLDSAQLDDMQRDYEKEKASKKGSKEAKASETKSQSKGDEKKLINHASNFDKDEPLPF